MMRTLRLFAILLSLLAWAGCSDDSSSSPAQSQNANSSNQTASNVPPPPPPPPPPVESTSASPSDSTAKTANAPAPVPANTNLPTWQPEQAALNQLDDYIDFDNYQIRIPKGYKTFSSPPTPPGAKAFAWAGDLREDGSRPMVMVMIMTPPPGAVNYSLNEVLASMLKGVKNRRENWQQSADEKGLINGIEFVKTSWQGADTQNQLNFHGIEYVAQDGSSFIAFRTQDIEPHLDALKIGETSILTFRKK